MKRILCGLMLALILATPLTSAEPPALQHGEYDPCTLCAMGFWVHCWSCAIQIAWEQGTPWGWWE